jgi:hypothetical protein
LDTEEDGYAADNDGWSACAGDCQDNNRRVNGVEYAGLGWQDISCFDLIDNDCDFYYATPQPGVTPETPGTFTLIQGAVVDNARGGVVGDFPFGLPGYTGTVWIRVLDTVPNGGTLDRLYMDYISVKTTP